MKKSVLSGAFLAVMALAPAVVMASTGNDFGAADFVEHSNKVQDFLFGPVLRLAGIAGGAYGLMQSITTSSVSPILMYGSVGVGANLMPKFINGVFDVSGMLVSAIGG